MPLLSLTEVQCAHCSAIRPLTELIPQGDPHVVGVPACSCGALEFLIETDDNPSPHAHLVNELFAILNDRPMVTFSVTNPNPLNSEIPVTFTVDKNFPCNVPILINGQELGIVTVDHTGQGLFILESPDPTIILLSTGSGFRCLPCEVVFNE